MEIDMNTQTIKTKVLNLLLAERPASDLTSKGLSGTNPGLRGPFLQQTGGA